MNLLLQGLKWVGITIGLAILSLIGFVIAAWLSPGDPGRSYLFAEAGLLGALIVLALWRFPLSLTQICEQVTDLASRLCTDAPTIRCAQI
jgi:4-amino-4-deoxy-L-arabinose transferase-like glycosyltransferase